MCYTVYMAYYNSIYIKQYGAKTNFVLFVYIYRDRNVEWSENIQQLKLAYSPFRIKRDRFDAWV